jgi:hypothetical protein
MVGGATRAAGPLPAPDPRRSPGIGRVRVVVGVGASRLAVTRLNKAAPRGSRCGIFGVQVDCANEGPSRIGLIKNISDGPKD